MTTDQYKEIQKQIEKGTRKISFIYLMGFLALCAALTFNMLILIKGHGKEIKDTAVKMLSVQQCPDFYKEQLKKRADNLNKEKRI